MPSLYSVTAPWAFPSALVTIVLTLPVAALLETVGSAGSGLAIVNVVVVGVLNTMPFSLNVTSSVHRTCTLLPTFKS